MKNRVQKIQVVFQRFDDMAVGDIKKAFNGGAKVGAFILTLVALDCLATWYKGKESNAQAYEEFICDFFPDEYKSTAKNLYIYLRSGLIHNYSTKKQSYYALVDRQPHLHLTSTAEKAVILNWENFFEDFLSAKDKYYEKVLESKKLQHVFLERVKRQGVLDIRDIFLANSVTATASLIGDDDL
jgi:hypothetical protein